MNLSAPLLRFALGLAALALALPRADASAVRTDKLPFPLPGLSAADTTDPHPPKPGPWRSKLYPENPDSLPANPRFESDAFLQDFSYAGYRAGEAALPSPSGPVFDVTAAPYRADRSGKTDATQAIRAAIAAAAKARGGVVLLPAGSYRLSLGDKDREALLVDQDNVVLRGAGPDKTFLLNTTLAMRERAVIRVASRSGAGDFFQTGAASARITADLLSPTRRLPVDNPKLFKPGAYVVIRQTLTDAWIDEHHEPTWKVSSGRPRPPAYFRRVVSVDNAKGFVEVDVPIRYYLKLRDEPVVRLLSTPPLSEVGVEGFSIANVQHPGKRWEEGDYGVTGTPGYEVAGCYLIAFERVRDGWIRDVRTYRPEGNTSGAHQLSNGILLSQSTRVTVADCDFRAPQYGGGDGNGYMYRLSNASNCLVLRSRSTFARHGFVLSSASATGNVFHGCRDTLTGRACGGSGSYLTEGQGSDHHMQFSHANLTDSCTADDAWWEARYRPNPRSGGVRHGVTSAHSVYWNVEGAGDSSRGVVVTDQGRYGYVIGTRGKRPGVERPSESPASTAPADWVEGIGRGDTLVPASLYLDQLRRRTGHGLLP